MKNTPSPTPLLLPKTLLALLFLSFVAVNRSSAQVSTNLPSAPAVASNSLPSNAETAAMPARLREFKRVKSNAIVAVNVFPARIGKDFFPPTATDLANLITGTMLCRAVPARQSLRLPPPRPEPNELLALWDFSRDVRDVARKKPAGPNYTLYADFAFNPQRWDQGFVHFVLCDPQGEWVIVDMQNARDSDYRAVMPTNWQTCDQVIARRMQNYLR